MSHDSSDLLDDAISAMKSEAAIPGPGIAVIDQTLQRVRDADKPARSIFRPMYAVAASVLMGLGLVALLCLLALPAKTELTWGDVVATMSKAQTMTCRMTIRIDRLDRSPRTSTTTGKLMIKSPGLSREEKPGQIIITNWPAHKQLIIIPRRKIASFIDLIGAPPSDVNPVETFDEIAHSEDFQPLGRRDIDGVAAVGFQSVVYIEAPGLKETETTNVWADAKTHRILQCIIDTDFVPVPGSDIEKLIGPQKGHTVMDNIQWNVPLDNSLFSIEVPPGYQNQKARVTTKP